MRVLLATDGSEDARAATRWLLDLPLPAHASVRVLSVFNPPHSALDIAPVRDFVETSRAACRRDAEDAAEMLAPVTTAEVRVVDGEPREVIAREACEWPADLVVVGARAVSSSGTTARLTAWRRFASAHDFPSARMRASASSES